MTTLARSGRDTDPIISIECDVCLPPVVTAAHLSFLRSSGWRLVCDGHSLDVCPQCRRVRTTREQVRRSDPAPVAPDPARLPNLMVVGAAKSGTSSVHTYLDLHPEIAMTSPKELRFFTDPRHRDWLGSYQSYFVPGTRYRGESTPAYTMHPLFPGVVDRMADLVPDARLIYVVRDPLDRLVAEYVENLTWGSLPPGIDQALADLDGGDVPLLTASRYAVQLRELYRRYPREQVHVLDMAALARDPRGEMDRIFAWLGLEPCDLTEEALQPQYQHEWKRTFPDWYQHLRQPWVIRLARRMPTGLLVRARGFVRDRVARPVEKPELSADLRARLRDRLAPEMAEFRELTGITLDGWCP